MNHRQAKKRMCHKSKKHGGWKLYKYYMKRIGIWAPNCISQKEIYKMKILSRI